MIQKNNKKAQGLSLNTVIIGVILLVVLAVVIFVFFRGTSTFSDGISTCDCVVDKKECTSPNEEDNTVIAVFNKCETVVSNVKGNYCCTVIG
jgi:flagellar basal body-associated protein FliL